MIENYITGANGFIGRKLCQRIKCTPIPHQDIQTTKLLPFERFFFLSAYGNMSFHTNNSMIVRANVIDPLSIVTRMDKGFDSFMFISTSSVKLPIQTLYSRTKRATEEVLLAYRERGLPICIIRPMSVCGAGEQSSHLIPTLIRSCLKGEKMNFVPEPKHDFIDVEDLVDGILNLSANKVGGIFELGTGKQYSNDEVREIVEDVTGKKANLNTVKSMRDYDTNNWVSSNFRARSWGWLPKKSLRQSIEEEVKSVK